MSACSDRRVRPLIGFFSGIAVCVLAACGTDGVTAAADEDVLGGAVLDTSADGASSSSGGTDTGSSSGVDASADGGAGVDGSSGGTADGGDTASAPDTGGDAGEADVEADTAGADAKSDGGGCAGTKELCNGKDDDCDGETDEDSCNDGNDCKNSKCDPQFFVCAGTAKPDGALCDNGQNCNGPDYCQGGVCLPGPATNCNDGSPCTTDSCDQDKNLCNNVPLANGAACSDGDACTTGDICDAAKCRTFGKVDCEDNNVCTADACDPATGCVHKNADGAACDDGDKCTDKDTCKDAKCEAGQAKACPAGKPCELATCSATDGSCALVAKKDGDGCADGDPCVIDKACKAGACTGGTVKDCGDGNFCTKDTCVASGAAGNCLHIKIPDNQACDDGNKCTTDDTCKNNVCVTLPKVCDDGKACTTDVCEPAIGCVFTNNSDGCDDGDKCTISDVCAAGACKAGAPKDCDDGLECTVDACDGTDGTCGHDKSKLDGKACVGDGSKCTPDDKCDFGKCVLGKPKDCSDGKACTSDDCDAVTATCSHKPLAAGAKCNDDSYCTLSDSCDEAGKCTGKPLPCNDHNGCTADNCDPKTGACTFTEIKAGQPCDDENECTTGDTCNTQLQCQPGTLKNCDDGNKCSKDGCDPQTGKCTVENAPGDCDDGSICTISEHCIGGVCAPGGDGRVTTWAGTGASATTDGPRLSATFKSPTDIAVADDGTAYILDSASYRIRKVDTEGNVTTFVGSGATSAVDGKGTAAAIGYAYTLGIERSTGELWLSDTNSHTVRRIQPDGTVTTVAGAKSSTGTSDGQGSSARFYYPRGLDVGPARNVYIADYNNHRIRKLTQAGVVSTLAGSTAGYADGKGAAAKLYRPVGIAVDDEGLVFVAEYQNHRIRRVTLDGTVTTLAGSGSATFANGFGKSASFYYPVDISWSPAGYLVVVDRSNQRMRKVSILGEVTTLSGSGAAGFLDGDGIAARFNSPYGAGVDKFGRVFVADTGNNRIRQISVAKLVCDDHSPCTADTCDPKAGCQHVKLGVGGKCTDGSKCETDGICNDKGQCQGKPKSCDDSNSCTSDSCDPLTGACVYEYSTEPCDDGDLCSEGELCTVGKCMVRTAFVSTVSGNGSNSIVDGIGGAATHMSPRGMARDGKGLLYVAEYGGHRIRQIDEKTGAVKLFAGSGSASFTDGAAATARFYYPTDVAVAGNGDVYVCDRHNNRIRRIRLGTVSTWAGSGSSSFADGQGTAARFYNPEGMGLGIDGKTLYIADSVNNRIRKIDADQNVTTVIGQASGGYSEGAINEAQFNRPADVAQGTGGELYIADFNNHRVRVFDNGKVRLLAGNGQAGHADGKGVTAQFYYPSGLDYHDGRLYVADRTNHVIRVVEKDGAAWTLAGQPKKAGFADGDALKAAQFSNPGDVLWTPDGVLISDTSNYRIRRLVPTNKDCDDGDPCTTDSCDQKTGKCVSAAIAGCCVPELQNNGFESAADGAGMVFEDCAAGYSEHFPNACAPVSGAFNSKGWQLWLSNAPLKKSGNGTAYYGYPAQQTHAFGYKHAGRMFTKAVRVPPGTTTTMSFSVLFEVGTAALYDRIAIWLWVDGKRQLVGNESQPENGSLWYRGGNTNTPGKWYDIKLDVTKYAGKKVQIEAYFNSAIVTSKAGRGVFIDDYKIIRQCPAKK